MRIQTWRIKLWVRRHKHWLIMTAVSVLFVAAVLLRWDGFRGHDSAGAALRNAALVLTAFIALYLGAWRTVVATSQADTAERGLAHDRLQRSIHMLESPVMAVRLGAIGLMEDLMPGYGSEKDVERYHLTLVDVVCAFVRQPPDNSFDRNRPGTDPIEQVTPLGSRREDIQEAMRLLSWLHDHIGYERYVSVPKLDLTGAKLAGVKLPNGDLCRADFSNADLRGAILTKNNLEDSRLCGAHMEGADLTGCNISNADLSGASGITQSMLDSAAARPEAPPCLGDGDKNATDPQTGLPLAWRDGAT